MENTNEEVKLIRILSKDIPGSMKVYAGLTSIKGISWSFSNVICKRLNIDKNKKIQNLSKEEIEKITNFMKKQDIPQYFVNRKNDISSGNNMHLVGADLDLQKDFDIKRLKKIKSYKGIRHTHGLPVRGQRTKSHFRKNRKKSGATGLKKKGVTK
ncbi:MAG: 30S ribosomal protein S13 [Nanoarchaeota archaeon]